MALTTTMVSAEFVYKYILFILCNVFKVKIVFSELISGRHEVVRLCDDHRCMYYKEHKLIHEANDHVDYHRPFLQRILKSISTRGFKKMGFVEDELARTTLPSNSFDMTLKLPDDFFFDAEGEPVAGPSNPHSL